MGAGVVFLIFLTLFLFLGYNRKMLCRALCYFVGQLEERAFPASTQWGGKRRDYGASSLLLHNRNNRNTYL